MKRKPDTPVRKSRRKYEERNKDERKEKNKVWGTSIDRQYANEIDEFLARHNLTISLRAQGLRPLRSCFYRQLNINAEWHKEENDIGKMERNGLMPLRFVF